jgi:hypothetical protein
VGGRLAQQCLVWVPWVQQTHQQLRGFVHDLQ